MSYDYNLYFFQGAYGIKGIFLYFREGLVQFRCMKGRVWVFEFWLHQCIGIMSISSDFFYTRHTFPEKYWFSLSIFLPGLNKSNTHLQLILQCIFPPHSLLMGILSHWIPSSFHSYTTNNIWNSTYVRSDKYSSVDSFAHNKFGNGDEKYKNQSGGHYMMLEMFQKFSSWSRELMRKRGFKDLS